MRAGVQPGQLPAEVGTACQREALDDDNVAGETDQDRCEDSGPFAARVLPDGRGSGSAQAVRCHSGTHPTTAYRGQHGSVMMPRHVARETKRVIGLMVL